MRATGDGARTSPEDAAIWPENAAVVLVPLRVSLYPRHILQYVTGGARLRWQYDEYKAAEDVP